MSQENVRSKYSKIWMYDESIGTPEWESYNKHYIQHVASIMNELLYRRGFVFLNEVYEELGIPMTKAGQIVGWIKNSKYDTYIEISYEKIGETPLRYLLDFNVGGNIIHVLEEF